MLMEPASLSASVRAGWPKTSSEMSPASVSARMMTVSTRCARIAPESVSTSALPLSPRRSTSPDFFLTLTSTIGGTSIVTSLLQRSEAVKPLHLVVIVSVSPRSASR